jgi:hypothetical protein
VRPRSEINNYELYQAWDKECQHLVHPIQTTSITLTLTLATATISASSFQLPT